MKEDLTHYFLVNPLWFFAGLIIYFILTLFKVHLIWYIQPKIYSNNKENLFKDYFTSFFETITSKKKIIKPAFRYLFRYNDDDFLITNSEDIKPIKKRLNILEGFTSFLKPYLIFSLIWVLIEFWISEKFFYNDTKIAFGETQKLLHFIDKLSLVYYLKKNKVTVLLFYGILCVLIPFLYEKETTTKKYKIYFTQSLVYLSLIANISFFGVQTGKVAIGKSKDLAELQTKITSIHDSIYKEIAIAIAFNDFKDTLKYENNLYNNEVNRFNNLITSANELKIDSTSKEALVEKFGEYLSQLKGNYLIENSEPGKDDFNPDTNEFSSTSKTYENYFESNLKNTNQYSEYANYMGNSDRWNKENGEIILNEVRIVAQENISANNLFEKKLEKILGHLFDFGIESSVTGIFTNLKIGTHKSLKKVVTIILSENYKGSLIERTIKILNYYKKDSKKSKEVFTEKANFIKKITSKEIIDFTSENNTFFEHQKLLAETNTQLVKDITSKVALLKINLPDNKEILTSIQNFAQKKDNKTLRDENDAKIYLAEKGYKFDEKKTLKENLLDKEICGLTKNLSAAYSNKNDLSGYNEYLKNCLSNLAIKTADITLNRKIIKLATSPLCPFCGLPITSPSPFCPTKFLKPL